MFTATVWQVNGIVKTTPYSETWTAVSSVFGTSGPGNGSVTNRYAYGRMPGVSDTCGESGGVSCQVTVTHWSVVGDIPGQ